MNETTRNLLLKTRKGATASFETKQWKEVLEALGAQVQVEKTRNTITKVIVRVPDTSDTHGIQGFTLVIEKEPNYRRVTFYKLGSFLKDSKFDLVELASKALGMETPEVEKKLNDLYVRDLTNTGTCAVCEGNFKRLGTGIGHHGFRRPGDGMLHGSCFAVGYLPFELSPIGAEAYITDCLVPHLEGAVAHLARLNAGEITKFFRETGYGSNKKTIEVTRESDEYQFESMLKSAIYQAERDIRWTENEIVRFKAKVANWKPDELPEVKYAGKFKAA